MIVFILTNEPYHDNSIIIGVFATIEGAKVASGRDDWDDSGFDSWPNVVAQSGNDFDLYLIYSFKVDE